MYTVPELEEIVFKAVPQYRTLKEHRAGWDLVRAMECVVVSKFTHDKDDLTSEEWVKIRAALRNVSSKGHL